MSQKKVDNYKALKANRRNEQRKEKFYDILEKVVGIVVCVALVAWIGYSVYDKATEKDASEVQQTVMDTSALDDYVNTITADTAEAE